MNNLGYGMYILEQEGYLDTRESKINAAIKDYKDLKRCGILDNSDIDRVLRRYGLSEAALTDAECRKIQTAVMGR